MAILAIMASLAILACLVLMARRKINPPNPKPIAAVTHRRPKKSSMKRKAKVFGVKKFYNIHRNRTTHFYRNYFLADSEFFTPYKEIVHLLDQRKG